MKQVNHNIFTMVVTYSWHLIHVFAEILQMSIFVFARILQRFGNWIPLNAHVDCSWWQWLYWLVASHRIKIILLLNKWTFDKLMIASFFIVTTISRLCVGLCKKEITRQVMFTTLIVLVMLTKMMITMIMTMIITTRPDPNAEWLTIGSEVGLVAQNSILFCTHYSLDLDHTAFDGLFPKLKTPQAK